MKKRSAKQIAALIAVILLVAMYVLTFVVAIIDKSASGKMFAFCLVCTVAVPLLAWIFIWIYGQYSGKKTIADLNMMQDPDGTETFEATGQEETDDEHTDTQADDVTEADAESVEE